MNSITKREQGASLLGIVIILAILGTVVYLVIQYIPQYMESGKIDSILSSVEKAHRETPANTTNDVKTMIAKRLQINEMDEMEEVVAVADKGDEFVVTVSYERELNLLYKKEKVIYEKIIVLEK